MVWVNDTYLMLVPHLIRRKDVNLNVGFFLHSPFPSSDIFKMFPHREILLKSLLCCDLLGFHVYEYARQFTVGCRRILGLKNEFEKGGKMKILSHGRQVYIKVSHIGIDFSDIKQSLMRD